MIGTNFSHHFIIIKLGAGIVAVVGKAEEAATACVAVREFPAG